MGLGVQCWSRLLLLSAAAEGSRSYTTRGQEKGVEQKHRRLPVKVQFLLVYFEAKKAPKP